MSSAEVTYTVMLELPAPVGVPAWRPFRLVVSPRYKLGSVSATSLLPTYSELISNPTGRCRNCLPREAFEPSRPTATRRQRLLKSGRSEG